MSGFAVIYTANAGYFGPDSFTYEAVGLTGSGSQSAQQHVVRVPVSASASSQALSAAAIVNITIPAPTVSVVQTSLPNGQAASPYSQTLTATGGTAPYTFTISAGALPAGLTLSSAGVLSGTPAAAGPFGFTVKATDSSTGTGPFSGTQAFSINLAPLVPTAPTLTVQVAADKVGTADVTTGATGGPFTGAAIVSVSPSTAGTASLVVTSGTVGVNAAYALNLKPTLHYSGNVVVTYTLSNAYAASPQASVTFQVAARPDPTLDPDVRGLIQAQAEAAVHMANAQIANFNQRLESLHHPGAGKTSNGMTFAFGDGPEQPGPDQNPMRLLDTPPASFGAGGLMTVSNRSGAVSGFGVDSRFGTARARFAQGPTTSTTLAGAAADGGDGAASKPSPFSDDLAFWTGGAVDFGMRGAGPQRSGLKFSTAGISVGADYRLNDRLILGAGLGYGQDTSRIGSGGTHDKATSYTLAGYGSYHPGEATFIDAVVGYADMHFDSRRFYAAAPETEYGKRGGGEVFGSLTAAWEYRHDRVLISPYGRVDAVSGSLDAFTETGGVGALSFAEQTVRSLKSTLGVRGDYLYPTSSGVWQPRVRVEYQHEFDQAGAFGLQYADWLSGPSYSSTLATTGRDHLVLGLGADFRRDDLTLSLDYKTDVDGSAEIIHQIAAKLAWRF